MRIPVAATVACLAWSLTALPVFAQDDRAETCAVEGAPSPDDAIIACGFVIHAEGSTAATRLRALLVRAEIQRRLSHPDLAMQDCDAAIRLDPASARAFELRGRVRTDAKQYERALDDFDHATRLDKELASAFAGRAATFSLMRQHRLAVRDYTDVAIWGRHPSKVAALVERLAGEGYPVRACEDLAAGVAAADTISCVTTSREPLVRGEWLRPGTHLDLVTGGGEELYDGPQVPVRTSRVGLVVWVVMGVAAVVFFAAIAVRIVRRVRRRRRTHGPVLRSET